MRRNGEFRVDDDSASYGAQWCQGKRNHNFAGIRRLENIFCTLFNFSVISEDSPEMLISFCCLNSVFCFSYLPAIIRRNKAVELKVGGKLKNRAGREKKECDSDS